MLLLVASYFFYMSWMKVYGLLLFVLTAANFLVGLLIARFEDRAIKRLVFIAGITINLGCLALFKYTNFFIDSIRQGYEYLAPSMHLAALPAGSFSPLPVILPLGISFFVFEFIHYLTDVFKGSKPMNSPVRFGLFAAFFPSQIAGPIKRFQDFEQQMLKPAQFEKPLFRAGLLLIMQGMFKKVVLGDNLAPIAQVGFAQPQLMGTVDAWVCLLAFALQIYYDFSGYTDIGRGSAMVLGFNLPENFNMPYIATSIKDFWHRWHISLSTWLKDYLFIPLGGSRRGSSRAAANLFITMLLGGLWHGASWHFVIWGGLQGFYLAANRVIDEVIARNEFLKKITAKYWWKPLAVCFTFYLVLMGWPVFRANNLAEAISFYQALYSWRGSSTPEATITEMFLQSTLPVALTLYACTFVGWKLFGKWKEYLPQAIQTFRLPACAQVAAVAGFALLVVGLAPTKSIPFIYFRF